MQITRLVTVLTAHTPQRFMPTLRGLDEELTSTSSPYLYVPKETLSTLFVDESYGVMPVFGNAALLDNM